MSLRLLGAGWTALLLLSFNVNAVTIDFQSLEHADALETLHGTSYSEDGFTITATSLYSFGTLHPFYRGSTTLRNGNQGTSTTLAATDSSAFNLTSIDFAEVDMGMATVNFTGNLSGGGTVTQSFILDGIFTTGSGLQTFLFRGFNNVTSVVWNTESPFHQFDNIEVEPVPLPAAAWLFLSGLLGLIGFGRNR
jgi:hypothetical protein